MSNKLDPKRILSEVKEIHTAYLIELAKPGIFNKNIFEEEMKNKYSYLYDNFKSIFTICMSKSYDYNRLEMMVNMANQVKNNDITEKEASIKVGQVLVDDIVKPQMKKD